MAPQNLFNYSVVVDGGGDQPRRAWRVGSNSKRGCRCGASQRRENAIDGKTGFRQAAMMAFRRGDKAWLP